MINFDQYNIIILDCDGVVFESNSMKLEAFRRALKEYDSKIVDNFIDFFKNNFGISRYSLVKKFIENFLNEPLTNELYNKILKEYSKNCILLYKYAKLTKYCINFLEYYKNKKIYIASGSDENELNYIFEKRGIKQYFQKILGSPRKKDEIVKEIVNENNIRPIAMIGDAKSDFFAAQKNNIDFIFMKDYSTVTSTMIELQKNFYFSVINNLGDLINE